MKPYILHYGRGFLSVHLPEGIVADLVSPNITPAATDAAERVHNAVQYPLTPFDFARFSTAQSVAIAVNDKTRPVPHGLIIPPILNQLEQMGISQNRIVFYIANGTHVPMKPDEYCKILPGNIIRDYKIVSHDCDDKERLSYLGITSHETPVYVNSEFQQSDFKIVIGNLEPHHFAGYSGGYKTAAIGLTGRQTINHNHQMLTHPMARSCELENNPLRNDIDEIGKMIRVHCAVNILMNPDKEPVEVLLGDPMDVLLAGRQIADQIFRTAVDQPYDLVIASCAGYPKDINLYQAQKALTHAAMVTRDGGVVILAAACEEGVGSPSYSAFMDDVYSFEEVYQKFTRQGFMVGPHKAIQIARDATRINIILVSHIQPDVVRKLLLTPSPSMEDALASGLRVVGEHARVAIMPSATNTVPIIKGTFQ